MTAAEYIAQYGANLTDAEKRYILAFGAPNVPEPGASRRQYTAGLRIADDESGYSDEQRLDAASRKFWE